MESNTENPVFRLLGTSVSYMRKCLFHVLSFGPIPNHLSFILDGNRRYAKKWNLGEGMGHRAGFVSLTTMIRYCYELGIKYVSVYAFSIDNFNRRPEEIQVLMDLMVEKIDGLLKEETFVNQFGVRVYFIGDLNLLQETVRLAALRAMKATANNTKCILLICVAYSSTNEIAHAVQESFEIKRAEIQSLREVCDSQNGEISEEKQDTQEVIKISDIERHMYMVVAPDPDILVRTSGENRLSNFLLWQTSNTFLYTPQALWPEIGLCHFLWAVLNFQRLHSYLEIGEDKEATMI